MGRLFKFLGFLIVIAVIAVIGYGYLGDLSPEQDDRTVPVELDAGS
jgi:hypothetical protein